MSSPTFFGVFAPRVRMLCGPIYEQMGEGLAGRNSHYESDIRLIEQIMTELDKPSGDHNQRISRVDLDEYLNDMEITLTDLDVSGSNSLGLRSSSEPTSAFHASEAKATPAESSQSSPSNSSGEEHPKKEPDSSVSIHEAEGTPKVEADACCDLCGYRPKGDPQWFKGSMAKHKKLQHSAAPPKIYKCPYPGCNSQYRSRPDNLRQHQIEKNHWAPGEDGSARRPSKRKKMAQDQD
jgi:hypothetical protein